MRSLVLPVLLFHAHCLAAPASEWPQFHGPRRDNQSRETGLLKRWPEGGPKLLWKADGIGFGFSSVPVAAGRIYTAGNIDHETVITALDLSGTRLWQGRNGPAYERSHSGSRATASRYGSTPAATSMVPTTTSRLRREENGSIPRCSKSGRRC